MGIPTARLFWATLATVTLAHPASAVPLAVNDVITGSSGNWVHNLSLSNFLPGTNDIYFFGVNLGLNAELARPANWRDNGPTSSAASGGSGTVYNDTFFTAPSTVANTIVPGATLGGFTVADHGSTPQTAIRWIAWAYNGIYTGGENYNTSQINPAFEGVVTLGAAVVPEPASVALLLAGLAAVCGATRARRGCANGGAAGQAGRP